MCVHWEKQFAYTHTQVYYHNKVGVSKVYWKGKKNYLDEPSNHKIQKFLQCKKKSKRKKKKKKKKHLHSTYWTIRDKFFNEKCGCIFVIKCDKSFVSIAIQLHLISHISHFWSTIWSKNVQVSFLRHFVQCAFEWNENLHEKSARYNSRPGIKWNETKLNLRHTQCIWRCKDVMNHMI